LILLVIDPEKEWRFCLLAELKRDDWYRRSPIVALIPRNIDMTTLNACRDAANACVAMPEDPAGYSRLTTSILSFWFGTATVLQRYEQTP
jgi:hypothetical protein